MRNVVIAAALVVGLSGCAVVWGGAWHVQSESPEIVVIRYDAGLMDAWRVQTHANDICGKYQKVAVPKSQRMGVVVPGGSIYEIVFSCDNNMNANNNHSAPLRDYDNAKILGAIAVIAGSAADTTRNLAQQRQATADAYGRSAAAIQPAPIYHAPTPPPLDPCDISSCPHMGPVPQKKYIPVSPGDPQNPGVDANGFSTR